MGPICGYRATKISLEYLQGLPFEGIDTISATDFDQQDREHGSAFMPKFDSSGLLTAVVTDSADGAVLMVAFMNAEALAKTQETGLAHFYSRSRQKLWLKGETSGHFLQVEEILVDCDQDALVLKAKPAGPACHTGARSCFYRRLNGGTSVARPSLTLT